MIPMPLLLVILLLIVFSTACQAGVLARYESASDFSAFTCSHARWDPAAGGVVYDASVPGKNPGGIAGAVLESADIHIAPGFDQVVVSWNASTPPGSYLVVYVRCRVDGQWTGWYNMGIWNRDGQPRHRTSTKGQDDDFAKVDTDTLLLKKRGDAVRIRVEMCSNDGRVFPTLRLFAVSAIDSSQPAADGEALRHVWGTELDVPQLCQLSVPGGNVWCSPTSIAMVLDYWGKKLGRSDLTVGITEAAHGVFDQAWGGTGNWVFNTAYAGEFKGIKAYVTRLTGVSQIESYIANGIPVIVSLDYNKLNRRDRTDTMGHLMVIRGFTREGDPIFNDPWAHLDKGETVRKVFKRADLEYAWLGSNGSHGTVYLVYPATQ